MPSKHDGAGSLRPNGVDPVLRDRQGGRFSCVIIGAFLAESAAVVNNKLDVLGGVLARYKVGPDRLARLVLVVLTQVATDSPVEVVEVEIRSPDGDEPRRISYQVPASAAAGEIGFAFFNVEVDLPCNGRWVLAVTCGPGAVSLPLRVSG